MGCQENFSESRIEWKLAAVKKGGRTDKRPTAFAHATSVFTS